LHSFTLLLYNSLWSAPLSLAICFAFGEHRDLLAYPYLSHLGFLFAFLCSCSSAFVLNYATYLCTQLNEALTTSVVGRTKSIVQGIFGLFAFHVHTSATNVAGIFLNSAGVAWYAYEKYTSARRATSYGGAPDALDKCVIHREDSQLTLEASAVESAAASNSSRGDIFANNGRMTLNKTRLHAR
jgi:solute carrier family 35 protein